MKRLIFVAAAAVLMTGCAVQRYDLQASSGSSTLQHDDAQQFWVGGIGQTSTVDAAKVCGSANKVARVETEQTPSNVVLSVLTVGIYSPRQIRVYCSR